jgi:hypothetical protein
MFNNDARHLFVIHPRQSGGGILATVLSLDTRTAALNFKNLSVEQKAQDSRRVLIDPMSINAHVYYGITHFMHTGFRSAYEEADHSERYVHKCHVYEMLSDEAKQQLMIMPNKIAVGMSYTENCIEELRKLPRGAFLNRQDADNHSRWDRHYTNWIYSNLDTMLPTYFGINMLHSVEFSDLLKLDRFMDHVQYISDELDLDIDNDIAASLILAWQQKLREK